MKPHHTKNDSLGNLSRGVNFIRAERKRALNRQQKIKKFDKLLRSEQIKYWRKFIPRGSRGQYICFIRENDKIDIINEIEKKQSLTL